MSLTALRNNDKSSIPQFNAINWGQNEKIQDGFCHIAQVIFNAQVWKIFIFQMWLFSSCFHNVQTCDENILPRIVKFNALTYLKVIHAYNPIMLECQNQIILINCIRLATKLFKQQNARPLENLLSALKIEEGDVEFQHFQNYFTNYFNQKLSLLSTPYQFINLAFLRNKITLKQKNSSKAIVDLAIVHVDSIGKSAQQIAQSSMKLAKNGYSGQQNPKMARYL